MVQCVITIASRSENSVSSFAITCSVFDTEGDSFKKYPLMLNNEFLADTLTTKDSDKDDTIFKWLTKAITNDMKLVLLGNNISKILEEFKPVFIKTCQFLLNIETKVEISGVCQLYNIAKYGYKEGPFKKTDIKSMMEELNVYNFDKNKSALNDAYDIAQILYVIQLQIENRQNMFPKFSEEDLKKLEEFSKKGKNA